MKTIENHDHIPAEGVFMFLMNGLQFGAIVSIEDGKWHASISNEERDMTYDEIKYARYMLLPDSIEAAMIFPPKHNLLTYTLIVFTYIKYEGNKRKGYSGCVWP